MKKAARNDPPSGPIITEHKSKPRRGVQTSRGRAVPLEVNSLPGGLGSRPNGTGSVPVLAKLAIRLGIPNKNAARNNPSGSDNYRAQSKPRLRREALSRGRAVRWRSRYLPKGLGFGTER